MARQGRESSPEAWLATTSRVEADELHARASSITITACPSRRRAIDAHGIMVGHSRSVGVALLITIEAT